jgi:hypothetical protein
VNGYQFSKDVINEYDICSEGKVFLITGSRTTGGFVVSKKTCMEKSIFNNVFLQYNDLGDYKTKEGDFFNIKVVNIRW